MTSAVVVFLLVATVCVSSTVAISPCSDVIIAGLSQHAECYTTGQPPVQKSGSSLGTHLVSTKGEIPSDAVCVTGSQNDGKSYATFYFQNKPNYTNTYDAVFYSSYWEETNDSSEIIYRLYVIHNEGGAYTYHRCIAEGGNGTGTHAVHVAVGCAYVNNNTTLAVVEKAKKCFNKLGITNYVSLEPCDC